MLRSTDSMPESLESRLILLSVVTILWPPNPQMPHDAANCISYTLTGLAVEDKD